MTDDAQHSSDDDMETPQQSSAELNAMSRKRRLLAMKSKMHGIEMKEEDYAESAQPTKKNKAEEKKFRSYQPISDALNEGTDKFMDLDVVEREIQDHLKDTTDITAVESIDVSVLAPKKIDWDLKRDIEKKLQKLEHRTQKAIAQIIRERLKQGKGDLANAVNSGAF